MNKKLFGRDGHQAELEDLYREAELGGNVRDAGPELQQEFASDQRLMEQLGRFAARSAPANPAIGRATLLAAVARQRSQSPEEDPRPMIGQFLTGRALALLATAGIFAGGAATVGASGGVSGAAGNVQDVLSALHITERTPDQADGHINGVGQPEASGTAEASATPEAEGTARAVGGIPTTNPSHQPEATPGVCNKGETIVKTTPSGEQVTVPCQTGEDHGQGNANSDMTPDADETPEASATAPNEHPGGPDRTPVPLPTQANHGATERAGNPPGH